MNLRIGSAHHVIADEYCLVRRAEGLTAAMFHSVILLPQGVLNVKNPWFTRGPKSALSAKAIQTLSTRHVINVHGVY